MSKFLKSLQVFAHTKGALVIVILLALFQINFFSLFSVPPQFGLSIVGSWLGLLVIAFAIIWAQIKDKVLLSHLILFFVYSSALAVFISSLFSNSPISAFDGYNIISLAAMAYSLGVVVGEFLFSKPTLTKFEYKSLFSLLLFIGAYYLLYNFTNTLVIAVITLGAVLLGSKIVALLYAFGALIPIIFGTTDTIIYYMNQNIPLQVSFFFTLAISITVLVFIILDLIKSFSNKEV